MQSFMKFIYEGVMLVLVMLTIITLWTEGTYDSAVNFIVWLVFTVDFLIRLVTAQEKWSFLKQNPFLLIAIIPFDQFFQLARIVRIFYLFRIKTITKFYFHSYVEKLTYRSRSFIGMLLLIVLLIESFLLWIIEPSVHSFFNAIYITFGHLFIFGHKIFIIEVPLSIWLLTCTSILGVVLQGLAVQWALSKVENILPKKEKQKNV